VRAYRDLKLGTPAPPTFSLQAGPYWGGRVFASLWPWWGVVWWRCRRVAVVSRSGINPVRCAPHSSKCNGPNVRSRLRRRDQIGCLLSLYAGAGKCHPSRPPPAVSPRRRSLFNRDVVVSGRADIALAIAAIPVPGLSRSNLTIAFSASSGPSPASSRRTGGEKGISGLSPGSIQHGALDLVADCASHSAWRAQPALRLTCCFLPVVAIRAPHPIPKASASRARHLTLAWRSSDAAWSVR
jgi:hypothetical protein